VVRIREFSILQTKTACNADASKQQQTLTKLLQFFQEEEEETVRGTEFFYFCK
jgi:23S rRNA maturation mini-RNase III